MECQGFTHFDKLCGNIEFVEEAQDIKNGDVDYESSIVQASDCLTDRL